MRARLILVFWLLLALPLYAQTDLRPAYRAYAQAQSASEPQRSEALRRALAVLQAAAKAAPRAVLYYDQGQIYRQLNQPALALWAYEQALWLNPRLAPAQEAAQRLRRELDLPRQGMDLGRLIGQVPKGAWGLGVLAAWSLGWVLWRRSKRGAFGSWAVALVLALGLSQPLWRPLLPAPAMVVEAAGLRLGPGEAYPPAGSLPLGARVDPLETLGQWAALEQEGEVLWVRRSALKAF